MPGVMGSHPILLLQRAAAVWPMQQTRHTAHAQHEHAPFSHAHLLLRAWRSSASACCNDLSAAASSLAAAWASAAATRGAALPSRMAPPRGLPPPPDMVPVSAGQQQHTGHRRLAQQLPTLPHWCPAPFVTKVTHSKQHTAHSAPMKASSETELMAVTQAGPTHRCSSPLTCNQLACHRDNARKAPVA